MCLGKWKITWNKQYRMCRNYKITTLLSSRLFIHLKRLPRFSNIRSISWRKCTMRDSSMQLIMQPWENKLMPILLQCLIIISNSLILSLMRYLLTAHFLPAYLHMKLLTLEWSQIKDCSPKAQPSNSKIKILNLSILSLLAQSNSSLKTSILWKVLAVLLILMTSFINSPREQ